MNRLLGPRWVFPAYWAVFLGATLVFHAGSRLDGNAGLLIGGFALAFLFGAALATANPPRQDRPARFLPEPPPVEREVPQLSSAVIKWVSFLGAAANLGAAALALRNSRFELVDILTLHGLAESTNALAVERYSGIGTGGPLVFIMLGIGYVAALVAPFIRLTSAKRHVLWMILPAWSSLAYAAVTSARLGFLVAVALTAGGIIACAIIRNGIAPRTRIRTVVGVVLVGAVLGAAFIGIGVLRTGSLEQNIVQKTIDKQASYTVGTVGAFSSWYKEYGTGMGQELGYGTATVAGVEYLTGQDRSATRAYGEFEIIDNQGRKSNVYTVFRGLILDFGIDGTLVFLTVCGFAFGRLYRAAVKGSVVAAGLAGFGYASVLFSGWMAMTTFTNILVVAMAAPLILLFARNRYQLAQKLQERQERRYSHLRSNAAKRAAQAQLTR